MSFFEELKHGGLKELTDAPKSLLGSQGFDFLNNESTNIINAMRGNTGDLSNLGFPQFDNILGNSGLTGKGMENSLLSGLFGGTQSSGIDSIFGNLSQQFGKNGGIENILGNFAGNNNPLQSILGSGNNGLFDAASNILNGGDSSLLGSGGLGSIFGKAGSGGFGDVFNGLQGLLGGNSGGGLGGMLGGLSGLLGNGGIGGLIGKIMPAISSLLPMITELAPLALAIL